MTHRRMYTYFYSGPLSQWHYSKFHDEHGVQFRTAEQYMMYQKAMLFGDIEIAQKILNSNTPSEQKDLGRKVKGFDKTIWDKNCLAIVYKGNLLKFSQNETLAKHLIDTDNSMLVEAAPDDCIWGVGLSHDDDRILNPTNWKGFNLLGQVLMLVRNELLRYK